MLGTTHEETALEEGLRVLAALGIGLLVMLAVGIGLVAVGLRRRPDGSRRRGLLVAGVLLCGLPLAVFCILGFLYAVR